MSIITNNDKIPKQIRGPISLLEYSSSYYKKHIYLFGEIHDYPIRCLPGNNIPIDRFLIDTIKATSKTIDLFLEIPHRKKIDRKELNDGTIENIYKKLHQAHNLRIHAIDIRQMHDEKSYTSALTNMFFDLLIMSDHSKSMNEIVEAANEYSSLAQKYLDITNSSASRDRRSLPYKPFLEEERIKKQIEDVTDSKACEAIINIVRLQENITYQDLLNAYNGASDLINARADRFNHIFCKISPMMYIIAEKLICFLSIIMDYYTLAHIFRSSLESEKEARNIIIYVGEAHAWRYKRVFEVLEFKLIAETYSDNVYYPDKTSRVGSYFSQSCLDISAFKQPFFSRDLS